jgi:hypothetical protein
MVLESTPFHTVDFRCIQFRFHHICQALLDADLRHLSENEIVVHKKQINLLNGHVEVGPIP